MVLLVFGAEARTRTGTAREENDLEEEAAVGSIHHILRTAFKELYRTGDEAEDVEAASALEAERRQDELEGGSGSGTRKSSEATPEDATNDDGEAHRPWICAWCFLHAFGAEDSRGKLGVVIFSFCRRGCPATNYLDDKLGAIAMGN